MGNFEKLSVLVIVVIIVMILVVALYTWTEDPNAGAATATAEKQEAAAAPAAPAGPNQNRVELPTGGKDRGTSFPKTPLAGAPAKNDGRVSGPTGFEGLFPPARPEGSQAGTLIDPGVTPPSPTPDPASAKPAEPRFHTVVAGDSYAKIAKQYYPGMVQRGIDELIKANPTIEPSRMRQGHKVLLPELPALASGPGAAPGTRDSRHRHRQDAGRRSCVRAASTSSVRATRSRASASAPTAAPAVGRTSGSRTSARSTIPTTCAPARA